MGSHIFQAHDLISQHYLLFLFQALDIVPNSPARIPKIVHQVWFDYSHPDNTGVEFPANVVVEWRDNCRRLNPDFEFKVWSFSEAEALIQAKYQFMWETWKAMEPWWIKQADTIRYLVLYEFGGIYMDMDMSCEGSLDSIIDDTSLAIHHGCARNGEYAHNSIMASAPGHWFWPNTFIEIINHVQDSVLSATGPHMLIRTVYRVFGSKAETITEEGYSYQEPDIDRFGIKILGWNEMRTARITHHGIGTWVPRHNDQGHK